MFDKTCSALVHGLAVLHPFEDADDIVLAGDVPGIVVAHRFRLVAFQSDGARLRTVTQGHEPR